MMRRKERKEGRKAGRVLIASLALLFILGPALAAAAEAPDLRTAYGLPVDNLITALSSLLAIALFVLTLITYRRDGRKRLLFVSAAFFLFAVKGLLATSDLFLPQKAAWVDPVANILDFAILLCFFVGIMKK